MKASRERLDARLGGVIVFDDSADMVYQIMRWRALRA